MRTVCTYFFIFVLYSFGGWVLETLLYILRDKTFVNRGFLFGPVCPIYGTGAVLCTAVLYNRVDNIFLLFLCGMALCGSLEYVTHFLMEKIFHAMWWDYSSRRFNINGRVYLNGLLQYGAGTVLIIKVFQPLVFKLTDVIPNTVLYIICFILYTILIVDIATTASDLKDTVKSIKTFQSIIMAEAQKGINLTDEKMSEIVETAKENVYAGEMLAKLKEKNAVLKRIKRKYPNFTLKKYKDILDIILDKPQPNKARTDLKLYGTADTIPEAEKTDAQGNEEIQTED